MYLQMLNQINIDNLAIHSGHLLRCLCDRYTQVSEHRFAVVSFEGKNHDFQFYPASVLIQNKHIKTTQFTGAIQELSTEGNIFQQRLEIHFLQLLVFIGVDS